jgi:hypothetical protein
MCSFCGFMFFAPTGMHNSKSSYSRYADLNAAITISTLLWACVAGMAQTPPGPADRLPPPGIAIGDTDRQQLTAGAAELRRELDALDRELAGKALHRRLSDVEIFYKAVDWALRYDEFFEAKQIAFARKLLQQGQERARDLRAGQAPWLTATGLVVRGYRSKIDGSVQPYGLVVPASSLTNDGSMRRLLVWLPGRNEKRSELAFLAERENSPGPFHPSNTIVLHPYGRFCNATKFAGEMDVFEAMAAVRGDYPIHSNRIAMGGFSMGGASAWHLAVHHASDWCAAFPGAGFAETPVYAKVFGPGKEAPPSWEQKLWHWYNATDYAGNLFNCPTVAYSGEIDPQKQSADIMEEYLAREGLKLERFIGPQTAHKYHPETQKELGARMETLLSIGRDSNPKEVHLTTYTLRYPQSAWVRIEGMEHHWQRADVRARMEAGGKAILATTNVTALSLTARDLVSMTIDGQTLKPTIQSGESRLGFHKEGSHWAIGPGGKALSKRPGLIGPIDDAFMDSFLFVKPSGKPLNEALGKWTENELAHATKMWRDIFRGDAPGKVDTSVTDADIAANNLVLWGDPLSNQLLARILPQLPLQWDRKKLVFNGQTYDAAHHAPILIFPNPLNPQRYVVLNSGMDFRNDAYGSNAKQTPKLPDWAIVDVDTPAGPRWPGRIAAAGFFDEEWKLE